MGCAISGCALAPLSWATLARIRARGARRMLRLRTPLSNHVSADERAIIALVGAIQHDRFEHAHALLNYLVQDHAGRTVMIHAVTIAKTMAKGGFNLAAPVAHRPIWTPDQIRLRAIA